MIYRILRWMSGIALHWFYGQISVTNRQRIPARGPLFIAVNHQNALVDSLITGWVVPRRVTMTAKATLTENPFIAFLFRALGVVPLRRVSDESASNRTSAPDRSRNAAAFQEILGVIAREGAVLIFPEGKSHNQLGLEPLKSGLARLALTARDENSIAGVKILPVGLVFEDKATPGSRVGVHVGDVIDMDCWRGADHNSLTKELFRRLQEVSEYAAIPPPNAHDVPVSAASPKQLLISIAAAWGRITHRLPVRMARRVALRQSRDADQPAMFTIVLGTGLALLSYALCFVVVNTLIHSIWISTLSVLSLLIGAYWAAFEGQRRV